MSSNEAVGTLWAWREERFPLSVFVPAAGVLTLASLVGGGIPEGSTVAHRFGLAVLLLLAFRLWDELMDRDADVLAHPQRVLSRSEPGPFQVAMGLTIVGALGLAAALSPISALVLTVLFFAGVAYYQWRPGWPFLLLKFPLMVLVLGAPLRREGAAAMALVYVAMLVDEGLQLGFLGRLLLMGVVVVVLLLGVFA